MLGTQWRWLHLRRDCARRRLRHRATFSGDGIEVATNAPARDEFVKDTIISEVGDGIEFAGTNAVNDVGSDDNRGHHTLEWCWHKGLKPGQCGCEQFGDIDEQRQCFCHRRALSTTAVAWGAIIEFENRQVNLYSVGVQSEWAIPFFSVGKTRGRR